MPPPKPKLYQKTCKRCHKSIASKHLKRHEDVCVRNLVYKCNICGVTNNQGVNMQRHLREMHNVEKADMPKVRDLTRVVAAAKLPPVHQHGSGVPRARSSTTVMKAVSSYAQRRPKLKNGKTRRTQGKMKNKSATNDEPSDSGDDSLSDGNTSNSSTENSGWEEADLSDQSDADRHSQLAQHEVLLDESTLAGSDSEPETVDSELEAMPAEIGECVVVIEQHAFIDRDSDIPDSVSSKSDSPKPHSPTSDAPKSATSVSVVAESLPVDDPTFAGMGDTLAETVLANELMLAGTSESLAKSVPTLACRDIPESDSPKAHSPRTDSPKSSHKKGAKTKRRRKDVVSVHRPIKKPRIEERNQTTSEFSSCEASESTSSYKRRKHSIKQFALEMSNKTKFALSEDDVVIIKESGIGLFHDLKQNWNKPYIVFASEELGMSVPENITYEQVMNLCGGSETEVKVIDVLVDETVSMTLGDFILEILKPEDRRAKLLNMISLEFTDTIMDSLFEIPFAVKMLSWVHQLWDNPGACLDTSRLTRPNVDKFCLLSMAGSYTDFHVDFAGSSVFYHVLEGEKIFFLAAPTEQNITDYIRYENNSDLTNGTFMDFLTDNSALYRLTVHAGQTLFMPSGYIHSVYTPTDSIVFGGNILTFSGIEMQFQIYALEKSLHTDLSLMFPHFELVCWLAAFELTRRIKRQNDKNAESSHMVMKAATVFLSQLPLLGRNTYKRELGQSCRQDTQTILCNLSAAYDKASQISEHIPSQIAPIENEVPPVSPSLVQLRTERLMTVCCWKHGREFFRLKLLTDFLVAFLEQQSTTTVFPAAPAASINQPTNQHQPTNQSTTSAKHQMKLCNGYDGMMPRDMMLQRRTERLMTVCCWKHGREYFKLKLLSDFLVAYFLN